jgi:hypothetical protein
LTFSNIYICFIRLHFSCDVELVTKPIMKCQQALKVFNRNFSSQSPAHLFALINRRQAHRFFSFLFLSATLHKIFAENVLNE